MKQSCVYVGKPLRFPSLPPVSAGTAAMAAAGTSAGMRMYGPRGTVGGLPGRLSGGLDGRALANGAARRDRRGAEPRPEAALVDRRIGLVAEMEEPFQQGRFLIYIHFDLSFLLQAL